MNEPESKANPRSGNMYSDICQRALEGLETRLQAVVTSLLITQGYTSLETLRELRCASFLEDDGAGVQLSGVWTQNGDILFEGTRAVGSRHNETFLGNELVDRVYLFLNVCRQLGA